MIGHDIDRELLMTSTERAHDGLLFAPADSDLLGAHVRDGGTTFGLWAPRAHRVQLGLVDEHGRERRVDLEPAASGTWRTRVRGVGPGQRYGFRVHGALSSEGGRPPSDPPRRRSSEGGRPPSDPPQRRLDPRRLLLDPYARAVTGGVDHARLAAATGDTAPYVPLGVVVADSPSPPPVAAPRSMAETVLYELHVAGFTRRHPAVPEHLRGSYAGLAHPTVVDYLVDLGVTAVELLPVHHFVSEPAVLGRGLTNYWGYNSLAFFAPHAGYAAGSRGEQVTEFKAMVSALHAAGLEVVLDVVFNHTAEGGRGGPALSFRGLDPRTYYRHGEDGQADHDVTGCGNSLDTSRFAVRRLVLDSLRYWVTEMGVDGFRFDLATALIRNARHEVDRDHPFLAALRADPVLRGVKLIAEPWDLGPDGYQLGAYGPGWSEWNDRYRDAARDFWGGRASTVQELGRRVCGSADLFGDREATAGVNFVTAHDGFTLRDLVSYQRKHNEANGEGNADGSDDDRSENGGVEGETDDPVVVARRHRQAGNLLATLLLSTGVPMLTAGDERGRTQGGNNNAYCQDSPISWLDWVEAGWDDLTELTRVLLRLRADHPVLRRPRHRHGEPLLDLHGQPTGRKNLAWFGGRAREMTPADWHDPHRRTLGMYLADDDPDRVADEAYLIWFHAGPDPVRLHLPDGPWARTYVVVAHTGLAGELPVDKLAAGSLLELPGRTVAVLQVD